MGRTVYCVLHTIQFFARTALQPWNQVWHCLLEVLLSVWYWDGLFYNFSWMLRKYIWLIKVNTRLVWRVLIYWTKQMHKPFRNCKNILMDTTCSRLFTRWWVSRNPIWNNYTWFIWRNKFQNENKLKWKWWIDLLSPAPSMSSGGL